MPETITNLLNAIREARGAEYAQGMVDMANLLQPKPKAEPGNKPEN